MRLASWRNPKAIYRSGGVVESGLFAVETFRKGELVCIKSGYIVDEAYVIANAELIGGAHLQITDEFFLSPTTEDNRPDIMTGFNHSCEPSAYVDGQIAIRAIREIDPGEEVTVDYSTCFTSDTVEFDCMCQSASCRKHIKPSVDWRNPQFQAKHRGYFATFIQEKIDRQDNV
jgi:hypothetical protein